MSRREVRRQRAQLAHHSPLPASTNGHALVPVAPRGSEGHCPHRVCAERGWASNAQAGVPSGWSLGRNLRSKTRWFTGFCNSHHVSHFATFFIDARAEISVAGSHLILLLWPRQIERCRSIAAWLSRHVFLGVNPRRVPTPQTFLPRRTRAVQGRWGRGGCPPQQHFFTRAPVVFSKGNNNDPSAGSPTETLLRLLLPLNDKVQWTSRDVTGGEPPASPRSEHFTGPFNR